MDGFTTTIVNRSPKVINSVAIQFFFPRPPGEQPSAELPYYYTLYLNADAFFYPTYVQRDLTKAINPGETYDLTIPDDHYQDNKKFLAQLKYPRSSNRIELSISSVGFTDETIRSGGSIYTRDPNNPERIFNEHGEEVGRASSRPATFLARHMHEPPRAPMFIKASGPRPPRRRPRRRTAGYRAPSLGIGAALRTPVGGRSPARRSTTPSTLIAPRNHLNSPPAWLVA